MVCFVTLHHSCADIVICYLNELALNVIPALAGHFLNTGR